MFNVGTQFLSSVSNNQRIPITEKVIQSAGDFPAPIGGKIQLENFRYIIDTNLVITDTLVFPSTGGCELSSTLLGGVSTLVYGGVGNMFEGTLSPTSVIVLNKLECSAPTGTMFSVSGTGGLGALGLRNTNIFNVAALGTLTSLSFSFNSGLVALIGTGWNFVNTSLVSIIDVTMTSWGNIPGTVMISFSGTIDVIQINSCRLDPGSNEFALDFPVGLTINVSAEVNNGAITQNPFAAGSRDQTDRYINFDKNSGVPDSQVIGTMFMNGNTTYTIIPVGGTGADGAITAFADAGGGQITVSSAGHGLSNGDTICIHNTINYNGSYVISNVAAGTFEITAIFVATETGTWEFGWILIAGITEATIIERCSLASNQLTFDILEKVTAAACPFTLNAVQAVASNKTYQFGVFRNGCRIDLAKNESEIGNIARSISMHPATDIEDGDVFDIRIRNMTDTQDLLVSNVQLVIK